jgi:hypothetical protein
MITDELNDLDYIGYFTLRGAEDSIRAKLEAGVEENGEILLSKIEYTEIVSLKPLVPEKKPKYEIDTLKSKGDTSNRKIKNDTLKNLSPKIKKEIKNQIKKRLRR